MAETIESNQASGVGFSFASSIQPGDRAFDRLEETLRSSAPPAPAFWFLHESELLGAVVGPMRNLLGLGGRLVVLDDIELAVMTADGTTGAAVEADSGRGGGPGYCAGHVWGPWADAVQTIVGIEARTSVTRSFSLNRSLTDA